MEGATTKSARALTLEAGLEKDFGKGEEERGKKEEGER